MEKRSNPKKNKTFNKIQKPSEILELEKLYGITLRQEVEENLFNQSRTLLRNFYALDKSNKIVGLSINNNRNNSEDFNLIRKLDNLRHLSLTDNYIEDVSTLFPLPSLEYLYLGKNNIKDISPLLKSPLLSELAIWSNPIENMTVISSFTNLKSLYVQNTGIENLDFILPLKNLDTIDLSENKISDIINLTKIEKLIFSDLTSNNIKKIPTEVAENFNWLKNSFDIEQRDNKTKTLLISNNPLEYPPNSVIELGNETVQNYYETANKYGFEALSEGRIIVIGDGSAGKSSLIERVLYDTFEQGKSQTNGIFIEHWKLSHADNRPLTFHIWDFGGQEIQHAVHKFFFTEGCLYVLVLDNRKEEEPEYWLQQIESLGGKAPVLVVFNKQDDNVTEIADRKFLKEKYPNIIGFYNTSCKTGNGIPEFKTDLAKNVVKLRTVEELFPNNWFEIKVAIEKCTSGEQHYLDYKTYNQICKKNNAGNEKTQKLLLKYFTTIGAVTWFGDTYLNFLHVLSPKWITQGVYKIITSKKTAKLYGIINIDDFKELLEPENDKDYIYDESHYGYILSMMKKFDLCYSPDDKNVLIPSAFGKVPKVEYSEFRGDGVRTYILQFKDYMPLALIHRFTAKKLSDAFDNNYWYSGIVIQDNKSTSLAMVQADKEAKRIYVRIKGEEKLGMWEHIRRELQEITSSYAQISYTELISLDDKSENTVAYEDLISHIHAEKSTYFHSKLQRDYNVGYLIGMFESKDSTLAKFRIKNEPALDISNLKNEVPPIVVNILNNNTPTVNTQINTSINIDIDINLVNNISSTLKGEAGYLLEELRDSNKTLTDALTKVIQFANDAKTAQNSADVIEKGWSRKLKSILQTLGTASKEVKNIQDGGAALKSVFKSIKDLAHQFNLQDLQNLFENIC